MKKDAHTGTRNATGQNYGTLEVSYSRLAPRVLSPLTYLTACYPSDRLSLSLRRPNALSELITHKEQPSGNW
jgi:hypothetical protein